MRKAGSWLLIKLPSGGTLSYASPKLEYGKITYMGVSPYTKQWGKISSYAGKFFENVTQKAARDAMMTNIPRIVEAGYDVRLRVHDEVIAYTSDNENYTPEELSALLATPLPWAPDMPLAATGTQDYRYRK